MSAFDPKRTLVVYGPNFDLAQHNQACSLFFWFRRLRHVTGHPRRKAERASAVTAILDLASPRRVDYLASHTAGSTFLLTICYGTSANSSLRAFLGALGYIKLKSFVCCFCCCCACAADAIQSIPMIAKSLSMVHPPTTATRKSTP